MLFLKNRTTGQKTGFRSPGAEKVSVQPLEPYKPMVLATFCKISNPSWRKRVTNIYEVTSTFIIRLYDEENKQD